ncbi:MAG: hypothetical protein GAK37_01940 [Pseudomonas sp.]|nr:MAG: hypothetical protein GAK37_01940 [Pseudomonas sp.]
MFAGQVVVKGVMHQAKHIQPANGLDGIHCHAFAPQGALFKAQRLDKAKNPVLAQNRRQLAQGGTQACRTLGFVA